MVDFKQEMKRADSREYYSLTQLPEDFLRIFLENTENYIVNHLEKLGDLTVEDIMGTNQLETLSLKSAMYILILR